jgi:RimJ/RimL family protein N-acetyltransferase
VEQKLGRKLHWWNDDVVLIKGVLYKKVFLRPEYKIEPKNYEFGGMIIENQSTDGYNEIYVNGVKVGYLILSPARKEYYWIDINLPNPLAIVDIKIFKEFRGKNYMKETMNWLFNFAKEKGYNSLFLRVDDDSELSQETLLKIYENFGFSEYRTDDDDTFMYKILK